ncbi:MAG: hypothetical protein KQI78_12975 [Deltaproteobacteria bacterium]|nr:hypothetical protein [Deltaproteobacteria bacterium]
MVRKTTLKGRSSAGCGHLCEGKRLSTHGFLRIQALLAVLTLIIFCGSTVFSGERSGYLKQDSLFKDRVNINDKDGRRKGYLKPDAIDDDRTNIYKKE